MKKILFLTETMKPTSGWGRIAYEISRRLPTYGFEPVILTEDTSGTIKDSAPLARSLSSLKATLKSSLHIRTFIRDCDLIHALDAYPYGVIGAIGNLFINKPLVMTAIGTYAIMPLESKRLRPFMLWSYRQADMVFPIVNYTTVEIKKRMTNPPPMERVLLGVDSNSFHFIDKPATATTPFFLSVGALKKRRGVHIPLAAFALIQKKYPDVQYRIVGDTSDQAYLSYLQSEIEKYGLQQTVKILGRVSAEDLQDLYEKCIAFIGIPENTATNFAGFHLVYLEANALGKPVIAGQGYGTEEVIQEGKNGFLVSADKPEQLAAVFDRLLSDSQLREQMRIESRRVAEELSWDKTTEAYVHHYNRLLLK